VTQAHEEFDDAAVIRRFPGRIVDQVNVAYYRGLLERRLLLSRCSDCGQWIHPPRPICPDCWSVRLYVDEPGGEGTIYLLTFLERDGDSPPHPVATVELDEQAGLRYTATIAGSAPPGAVHIGDRVKLTWIERNGAIMPAFELMARDVLSRATEGRPGP
jgi:uncharacterized OB-fold protein